MLWHCSLFLLSFLFFPFLSFFFFNHWSPPNELIPCVFSRVGCIPQCERHCSKPSATITREGFSEEPGALKGSSEAGGQGVSRGWVRVRGVGTALVRLNSLPSRCSRAPAVDGPVPEMHPPGPGPPAPTGHRLPAPASISQKLSAVPVSRGWRGGGGHPQTQACRFTVTLYIRRKSPSSPWFPRTFTSLKGQDIFPTLKMKCLLPTVFAALKQPSQVRHLLGSRKEPEACAGWRSCPLSRTAARQPPALIREPVSLFKRMNKTLGQDTFCCVPRCRQGQGKIGQLWENIAF